MKNIEDRSDATFQLGEGVYPKAYNLIHKKEKQNYLLSLVNIYDKRDVLFDDIPLEEVAIDGTVYDNIEDLQTAFDDYRVNFNSAGGSAELPHTYTQKIIYTSGPQEFALINGGIPMNVYLNRAPLIREEGWAKPSDLLLILSPIVLVENDEIYITGFN